MFVYLCVECGWLLWLVILNLFWGGWLLTRWCVGLVWFWYALVFVGFEFRVLGFSVLVFGLSFGVWLCWCWCWWLLVAGVWLGFVVVLWFGFLDFSFWVWGNVGWVGYWCLGCFGLFGWCVGGFLCFPFSCGVGVVSFCWCDLRGDYGYGCVGSVVRAAGLAWGIGCVFEVFWTWEVGLTSGVGCLLWVLVLLCGVW